MICIIFICYVSFTRLVMCWHQRIRGFSTTMRYINRHYLSVCLSVCLSVTVVNVGMLRRHSSSCCDEMFTVDCPWLCDHVTEFVRWHHHAMGTLLCLTLLVFVCCISYLRSKPHYTVHECVSFCFVWSCRLRLTTNSEQPGPCSHFKVTRSLGHTELSWNAAWLKYGRWTAESDRSQRVMLMCVTATDTVIVVH